MAGSLRAAADTQPEPLRRALRLETEQRWLAAAEAYAELTRLQPGVPEWQKRIRRCRLQEQITRRHLDPSRTFEMPFDRCVELYAEVLAKIDAHFVVEADYTRLFAHSLEMLDLALQNPKFLAHALSGSVSTEALARQRESLRKRFFAVQVQERAELVRRVRGLAIGLQHDVGARPTVIMQEFIHSACTALDEFSAYLPHERFIMEDVLAHAETAGIGIELRLAGKRTLIAAVAADGPAARAGLNVGDELHRIDDQPVAADTMEETLLRLMGRPGTAVVLEVHGPVTMQPRRVEVVRQRLSQPTVSDARIVDAELGIAYVHLAAFTGSTVEEFDLAIAKLTMLGMRGLILDLRGNPGGSFLEAVRLADRFISTGVIVTTRGRAMGSTNVYRTQEDADITVPLVLLIDGESASASEVVAGAVKDHRRGILVGTRSFGKGSMQHLFPLRTASGGVRLTTAKFYSPLDVCYDEHGVTPNVAVPSADGSSTIETQRRQFEAALRAIRELVLKPM
jgi:carboxyl-terminal processing protease